MRNGNQDIEKITSEQIEDLDKVKAELKQLEIEYDERVSKRAKFYKIFLLIVVPLYAILISLLLINESYLSKETIQNKLTVAINNGAPLDAVKNIYFNREKIQYGVIKRYFNKDEYYNFNVPLSQILYDLESSYFIHKNITDINISKVSATIKKYSATDQFDSLEVSQKDVFTNIQQKLSTANYQLIQNNLEKIAIKLTEKNILVNQYLKDSTNSFWISISALIFSAILGLIQLYYAREYRQRQIISEELKKHSDS